MSRTSELERVKSCSTQFVLAINDTLNVISSKWKLPIIGSLLEVNGIITRTVYDSFPVSIEYELTTSGNNLQQVLDSMIHWGLQHRKAAFGKK
jgi:DNA-binding HxlR family transcriptional regulator